MPKRSKYRRRKKLYVAAVQLDLETNGLVYKKWGGRQRAERGDWLVDNDGEIYTVEKKVFSRTYRKVRRGLYEKTAPVWAERAEDSGWIATKEGRSEYRAGDYLVYNDRDGADGYCMSAAKFRALYTPVR